MKTFTVPKAIGRVLFNVPAHPVGKNQNKFFCLETICHA